MKCGNGNEIGALAVELPLFLFYIGMMELCIFIRQMRKERRAK